MSNIDVCNLMKITNIRLDYLNALETGFTAFRENGGWVMVLLRNLAQ